MPELAQSFDAVLWRVACDQGRVDGPDGYACDPVEVLELLEKGFIDARLVGPQRPTPWSTSALSAELISMPAAGLLPNAGFALARCFVAMDAHLKRGGLHRISHR